MNQLKQQPFLDNESRVNFRNYLADRKRTDGRFLHWNAEVHQELVEEAGKSFLKAKLGSVEKKYDCQTQYNQYA